MAAVQEEAQLTTIAPGVARLMVADTGVGIPAEHIESIFEPFRQGAGSNGVRTGLGLGLAAGRSELSAPASAVDRPSW